MSTQVERVADDVAVELPTSTFREAVHAAIEDEMLADARVLLLGEDVSNAGGVFKTNEGLVEQFGTDRIINTPICENGFLGVALGMAVTGWRPIVEIMFSDFLPTAGDAIVEELPKFRFMSGGQSAVPITVRSIAGGTGRFGTQHSATGESWYMGLPGLLVATASSPQSAYSVLRAAIRTDDPVLFFEHKGLYGRKGQLERGDGAIAERGRAHVEVPGTDVTVVSTMLMTDRAVSAAGALIGKDISAEIIDLRWLRPLDTRTILDSVRKTKRLLVVEEQVHAAGWGATVISEVVRAGIVLDAPPQAVSLPDDLLIPYSPSLEDAIIPSVEQISEAIERTLAS
jgi:acetoin:2,6-dichlorophenolindophenol oxidoreductase subunit beta